MRTRQVPEADQKLAGDLTAGEDKRALEKLHPLRLVERMIRLQPSRKPAVTLAQRGYTTGVLDRVMQSLAQDGKRLETPELDVKYAGSDWLYANHPDSPLTVTIPAGQALTIQVVNASKETIEFESFKLNREKAIQPGESIVVHLPALSAGNYDFYDDFHQDVPQGNIVAK